MNPAYVIPANESRVQLVAALRHGVAQSRHAAALPGDAAPTAAACRSVAGGGHNVGRRRRRP